MARQQLTNLKLRTSMHLMNQPKQKQIPWVLAGSARSMSPCWRNVFKRWFHT